MTRGAIACDTDEAPAIEPTVEDDSADPTILQLGLKMVVVARSNLNVTTLFCLATGTRIELPSHLMDTRHDILGSLLHVDISARLDDELPLPMRPNTPSTLRPGNPSFRPSSAPRKKSRP